MRAEARGLVFDVRQRPASEQVTYFDSLCPLRSGVILCGLTVGTAKHAPDADVRICRSQDGGVSWQETPQRFATVLDGIPGSLVGAEMVEAEPGRVLLFATWFDRTEPERPLFDPETEGILRSKQVMAVSTDAGETWGAWQVLPTPGLTGCATTGPVVQWPDGTLAYAFESFKEFDDPRPAQHGAWLLISRDGGRRFETPHLVARDPQNCLYYWDQRLCPTDVPGEYVALFWTHDRGAKRDRNVHILRGTIDDSDACAQPQETTIPGQIAAPLLLGERRLLAFVVDRGRPGTLRLWQSRDGGRTWPEAESLVAHAHEEQAQLSQSLEGVDFAQYWEDMAKWTFGHPALRLIDQEHVLLTFYAGTPGRMSTHWVRIALDDA